MLNPGPLVARSDSKIRSRTFPKFQDLRKPLRKISKINKFMLSHPFVHCSAHSAAESHPGHKRDAGGTLSRITHALQASSSTANASGCSALLCFAPAHPASPRATPHAHMRKTCNEQKQFGARNAKRKGIIVFDSPVSTTIRWFGKGAEGRR